MKYLFHGAVIKRPHRYRTQTKSNRLQKDILRSVAGFDVHITDPSLAILSCCAILDRDQDENYWTLPDVFLPQGGIRQRPPLVRSGDNRKRVRAGLVAIDASGDTLHFARDQIHLEGKQRTGRRCCPESLRRGDSL